MTEAPLVLAMSGASGAPYAVRLLEVLIAAGRSIHLVISPAGAQVLHAELGRTVDPRSPDISAIVGRPADNVTCWNYQNLSAGIASGSFRTAAMVIVPCSMSTLAAIALGQGTNLIHRAADVHLKERRKLIVVPRETPLSLIALKNMTRLTEAGAVILPAMPGFYHQPTSIADLVNFVVARICDQLGVDQGLMKPWGG